ncbi:MAG: hypothetical protein ACFFCD_11460 [Promethearchaeota archaeon]
MTTILDDASEREKELLISILDNNGVIIQIWDLCFIENPPGKLVHWHASQLGVGIKRVLKIIRKFVEMGLVERINYKRTAHDTFLIPKYDLTSEGRKVAIQLKREWLAKQQQIIKDPSKCLMRVLIQTRSKDTSEDFLFATLKHRIGNLESVKIRTENIDGSKYLITRGDVVVVTMKQTSIGNKVLMKTLRLSEDQSKIVKKYAYSCSTVRRCLLTEKPINFMFVEQEPFICDLKPCGIYKKEKVITILKEWKNHPE